jgi:hypothetical protein
MYYTYSYAKAQRIWVKVNSVSMHVTRLKVVRKLRAYEGWNTRGAYWYPEMHLSVGRTYVLDGIFSHSVIINGHYYPFYVLEVVK